MTTPTIYDWILSELDIFERSPPVNYLSAALQIAVFHLLRSGISNNVDEESFTAALLGSFCESCQVCVAGMPPASNSCLTWRRHNKSSKRTHGESATGADFSLIIRHSNSFARAAVFQAKNGQSDVGSFTADHLSPATEHYPCEQQFVRLRRYCLGLLARIKNLNEKSLGQTNLDWAHYLIYEKSAIYCSPLSSLTILNDRINKNHSPGTVRYKKYPYFNFVDILMNGCNQEVGAQRQSGWLSLESPSEITNFVDSTKDLYDIYEAHVDPSIDWAPLIEDRETLSDQERIRLIKESLLSTSAKPLAQESAALSSSTAPKQATPLLTLLNERKHQNTLETEKKGGKLDGRNRRGTTPNKP
nr:hypothetical protein [Stenotrophomonas geniculata]